MKTTQLLPALAAIVLAAAPARAQKAEGPRAAAADFFDAGAQAYQAGQYLIAAEAFLRANDLSPSPALLFSAAQSYRRQFLTEPSAFTLRRAVALYREYLRSDQAPRRREDAMSALAALSPFELRFAEGGDAGEPAREAPTRLLLTTPAEGAEVSVDGGAFAPAPLVARVPPGAHQVRVRAAGYEEEQLTVQALAHELVPRHVVLRPHPARLTVEGPSGAQVSVDGQLRATLPLAAPLPLAPGAHFVAVTATGHQPFGGVVDLPRDGAGQLAAPLRPTRQRVGAWATLAVGAAGALTAGALGGVALVRQGEAVQLSDRQAATPLAPAERDSYNAALKARDDLARAAAIVGGVSVVALVAGVGMFALDRPEVAPPDDERLRAPRPGPRVELEVGLGRLGLRGSF